MATSLRTFQTAANKIYRIQKNAITFTCKRYLLSEAYSCNEGWKKYCEDPLLTKVSTTDLAFQIQEQLDKTAHVSAVDVNILAHHFHIMDEEELEFMEDILSKFNFCQTSFPRQDGTTHAIVLGYIKAGHGKRLINLLTDTKNFCIFPNYFTLNLALDWCLQQQDYSNASKVAYCSMLQEDFSNPTNTLLSLYATVHHLLNSKIEVPSPPKKEPVGEAEEEKWVKVKYIKFPYYDNHFDIKDERFLLGKTLLALSNSQSIDIPVLIRTALKVIGYGLYHKFSQGLEVLNSIANSTDGTLPEVAFNYFSESLEKVEARDPNEPEVELALRTIDDVIHCLLPTTVEKQKYLSDLAHVQNSMQTKAKVVRDFNLKENVVNLVQSSLSKYEDDDVSAQKSLFNTWTEERKQEVQRQLEEFKKNARIEEMKKQVKELQEQEELLRYFDFEEKLRLTFLDDDRVMDKGLTISK
ncbi:hypothetical protein Btru_007926 [Bulinus truncatus]|nr:hypothetical protein Btru_007926 [Bulinus truncatus]